jgi:hypothetical protein
MVDGVAMNTDTNHADDPDPDDLDRADDPDDLDGLSLEAVVRDRWAGDSSGG